MFYYPREQLHLCGVCWTYKILLGCDHKENESSVMQPMNILTSGFLPSLLNKVCTTPALPTILNISWASLSYSKLFMTSENQIFRIFKLSHSIVNLYLCSLFVVLISRFECTSQPLCFIHIIKHICRENIRKYVITHLKCLTASEVTLRILLRRTESGFRLLKFTILWIPGLYSWLQQVF